MEVQLVRATVENAEHIWKIQIEAFLPLLNKYQDYKTNPASEPADKVKGRLEQSNTYYYYIKADEEIVGAIRVIDDMNTNSRKRISPICVLPKFQNQGIAQKASIKAKEIHGATNWELDTILQEKGNCHLYEKMGYHQTGETKVINERMTLVFYQKD